jgi:hypothetical protein
LVEWRQAIMRDAGMVWVESSRSLGNGMDMLKENTAHDEKGVIALAHNPSATSPGAGVVAEACVTSDGNRRRRW